MKTTFHFKDEIQTYLESECIKQKQTRRLMNTKLTNFESCNILSIKAIKFKKHHENTSS
jgi:hypothetical protein